MDSLFGFISDNPQAVCLVVATLFGLALYYWPRTQYGPEYTLEGKVKETHHERNHSYTSTGTTFSNGHFGTTTQYHSSPEEFDVTLRVSDEHFYLNDQKLYELVDQGDTVSCVFQDRFLLYRTGTREPNGRKLFAVIKDHKRVDL